MITVTVCNLMTLSAPRRDLPEAKTLDTGSWACQGTDCQFEKAVLMKLVRFLCPKEHSNNRLQLAKACKILLINKVQDDNKVAVYHDAA